MKYSVSLVSDHGPLARYVKLRVAHALGMPGTFSPPPRASDPDMHHGTCATHVLWCIAGSLTSGFLWSRWRGKCSRYSRRMRNPQLCASGKWPMRTVLILKPRHVNENLLTITCSFDKISLMLQNALEWKDEIFIHILDAENIQNGNISAGVYAWMISFQIRYPE